MSVRVQGIVACFIPAQSLEEAARKFAAQGVTDLVLSRRDDYDEMCRLAKVARAFEAALAAAAVPPTDSEAPRDG